MGGGWVEGQQYCGVKATLQSTGVVLVRVASYKRCALYSIRGPAAGRPATTRPQLASGRGMHSPRVGPSIAAAPWAESQYMSSLLQVSWTTLPAPGEAWKTRMVE